MLGIGSDVVTPRRVLNTIRVSIGGLGSGRGSRGIGGVGHVHGVVFWRAGHLDSRGEDGYGARPQWVVSGMALTQGHRMWASLHHLGHLDGVRSESQHGF